MTNEHDWVDNCIKPQSEYGAVDFVIGWFVYAAAVFYLVV